MKLAQLKIRLSRLLKQLLCNHSHTFTYFLDNVVWESNGQRMGKHDTLCLKGCYKCGWSEVVDYGA